MVSDFRLEFLELLLIVAAFAVHSFINFMLKLVFEVQDHVHHVLEVGNHIADILFTHIFNGLVQRNTLLDLNLGIVIFLDSLFDRIEDIQNLRVDLIEQHIVDGFRL